MRGQGGPRAAPRGNQRRIPPGPVHLRYHAAALLPRPPGPRAGRQHPRIHGRDPGRPGGIRRCLRSQKRQPAHHRQRGPGQDPRFPFHCGPGAEKAVGRHLYQRAEPFQPAGARALFRQLLPAGGGARGRPAGAGRSRHRAREPLYAQLLLRYPDHPHAGAPPHHLHLQHCGRAEVRGPLHRKDRQPPGRQLRAGALSGRRHPPPAPPVTRHHKKKRRPAFLLF